MSKSRGTGIDPLRYLELGMNPEWLRYYIAAKLNANVEDIDFNPDDFIARVNSDLVGKYVNIASRCAVFLSRKFGGKLLAGGTDRLRFRHRRARRRNRARSTTAANSARRCARSWRSPTSPTSSSTSASPGSWRSSPGAERELHEVCSTALELFRLLTIYLKPVLPQLAARAPSEFLNLPDLNGRMCASAMPEGHRINEYRHLMTRVEEKQLDALFEPPVAERKEAP